MWPTLQALVKSGGTASNSGILEAIVEIMAIPDEIQKITHWKKKRSEIDYRAAWARTRLKNLGAVVRSESKIWSITDRGRRFDSEEQVREQGQHRRKDAGNSVTDDPDVVVDERETHTIDPDLVEDIRRRIAALN